MLLRYFFNDTQYEITFDQRNIYFLNCNTGRKTSIKVIDSAEYAWKLNKKTISARNGARGLFAFFGNIINSNFMTGYLNKTITYYNI